MANNKITVKQAGKTIFQVQGTFQGPAGPAGSVGPQGPSGVGIPTGGTPGQVLAKQSGANYDVAWQDQTGGGGGTAGSTSVQVTQAAHGFSVGTVLTVGSSVYARAQANSASSSDVVGIVSAVANANSFTLVTEGYVSGLSGLTAGNTYFLDPATPGGITATEPTTAAQIRKPLFKAYSATAGFFHNYEGVYIGSSGTGGGGGGGSARAVVIASAAYSVTNSDDIVVQTGSGGIAMHNPATATQKVYTLVNSSGADMTVSATTVNGHATYVLPDGLTLDLLPVGSNFLII